MSLGVAARLARRELRGGLKGFRIFLACLTLGVAAIATVQSVASGILASLREDGQAILGGDIALRLIFDQATDEQLAYLRDTADGVTVNVEMRSMARSTTTDDNTLVELKAVDDVYPLYGEMELSGGLALDDALASVDGRWGAALENSILSRLDLAVGDIVRVGDAEFEIRATIDHEPDRAGGQTFSIGPRLMIDRAALDDTGLIQPGSLIYTTYKVALPPGTVVDDYVAQLNEQFPEAGWRVRDFRNASPQLAETIGRLALFLTLVGLTALLVGGVGVGNAVKSFLDSKIATIATLKCLGATSGIVFATYLIQVMALASLGIVAGLILGVAAPPAVGLVVTDFLPVQVRLGVYPWALVSAAGFGLLTALTFSLWPLARARDIPAASLFRDLVAPTKGWPRSVFVLATAAAGLALAGLAIVTAEQPLFAAYFVGGAVAAMVAFRTTAWLVIHGAQRLGRPRHPGLRMALTNLYRPGAPTAGVVLSLGLGLTVLIAIALIEGNMSRQVRDSIPSDAPAYFFVDIQPNQIERFHEVVTGIDGVSGVVEVPSMRGRIAAINGVPAEQALVDQEESWLLRGDRGVSYAEQPRGSYEVIDGAWWPADYDGPPLVSIYRDIATAFAIGVGDTITVNVLGRDIEAEVASIREINWQSMNVNFTLVFSPRPISAAPHTFIATVQATGDAETAVQRAVTEEFPNVTAVRVRDALDTVNDILGRIGDAVRGIAAITLVAGTLVLAGAIAAGHRRRVYESVVLKVLGATRSTVMKAFAIEYGLLGLITAGIAGVVGTIAGWAVLTQVMNVEWTFLPTAVLTTAALCTAITVAFGFVGTWRALGQKAAPLLRND